jgi:hypothetical protein
MLSASRSVLYTVNQIHKYINFKLKKKMSRFEPKARIRPLKIQNKTNIGLIFNMQSECNWNKKSACHKWIQYDFWYSLTDRKIVNYRSDKLSRERDPAYRARFQSFAIVLQHICTQYKCWSICRQTPPYALHHSSSPHYTSHSTTPHHRHPKF